MKKLLENKLSVILKVLYLLGIFYVINIVYLLRLNPDPHHDGILISAGYTANSGLVPQKDFYFLWGPILPYFLTIPVKINDSLYFFRIFGYLIMVATCYLMYLLSKYFLSKKISIMLATLWLATFPAVSKTNFDTWPNPGTTWPNIYGFLLVLSSCLLVFSEDNEKKHLILVLKRILTGLLILSTIFIRIDFIFIYIGFLFFIFWKYKNFLVRLAYVFPLLVVIGSVFYFIRINNNFWSEWYSQTILNLFSNDYSSGVPTYTLKGVLRAILSIALIAIAFVILNFRVHQILVSRFFKLKIISSKSIVLTLITSLILCFYFFWNGLVSDYIAWLKLITLNISFGYLAICIIFLVSSLLLKRECSKLTLIKIMAICSVPLLHNLNLEYIWLNSIFILMICTIYFAKINKYVLESFLIQNLVFCAAILIAGNFIVQNSTVYSFTHPILHNMQDRSYYKGMDLDKELTLIKKIPENSKFQNQCVDYLYSIANSKIIQASRALSFNLDPKRIREISKISDKWVFECNLNSQEVKNLQGNKSTTIVLKSTGLFSVIYKMDKE